MKFFQYLLSSAAPIAPHCHVLGRLEGLAGGLSFASNALLFFFRIRAVFYHDRIILTIFFLLFLAVTALCVASGLAVSSVEIAHTPYCLVSKVQWFGSLGMVASAVNDTLVFAFITGKLLLRQKGSASWRETGKMFLTGEGMNIVSRLLMQSGQLYYLCVTSFL